MREAEDLVPVIGIVVKRWPRLSETFVLNEILGLERAGLRLRIYALMDPHEPASQAAINEVRAPVNYLRTGTWADLRVLLVAQLALLRTAPWRYLRTLGYVLARRRHRSTFVHFFEAARLVALLREHGVSHIHAQFAHGPTSVAHFASLLGDVSFSFTGHAKDIYLSPPDLLAVKMAAARFVATCTAYNVAYLRELAVPADRAKIHLVYHGVATERFCPAPGTKGLGTGGVTETPVRMIAVGRLVEKKGYVYLIRACALLRQRGCRYTLAIYGGGPQRDELGRLIDAFDLGDLVQLQGTRRQEELIAIYREADLFVLSPQVLSNGDRDGIPNVLMEAMAVGLPVVATDVSGIPELIEHDRSGLLVPSCDEVALAGALERLLDPLDGYALRARLGAGGRERVVEHFDAALHVGRMVELLGNLGEGVGGGDGGRVGDEGWGEAQGRREARPLRFPSEEAPDARKGREGTSPTSTHLKLASMGTSPCPDEDQVSAVEGDSGGRGWV
jgi:glycosyltransferase involved in cell wall biosynthesis